MASKIKTEKKNGVKKTKKTTMTANPLAEHKGNVTTDKLNKISDLIAKCRKGTYIRGFNVETGKCFVAGCKKMNKSKAELQKLGEYVPEREDYEALAMSGVLHKAIQKTKKNGDSFEIAFLHSVDGKKGKKETKVAKIFAATDDDTRALLKNKMYFCSVKGAKLYVLHWNGKDLVTYGILKATTKEIADEKKRQKTAPTKVEPLSKAKQTQERINTMMKNKSILAFVDEKKKEVVYVSKEDHTKEICRLELTKAHLDVDFRLNYVKMYETKGEKVYAIFWSSQSQEVIRRFPLSSKKEWDKEMKIGDVSRDFDYSSKSKWFYRDFCDNILYTAKATEKEIAKLVSAPPEETLVTEQIQSALDLLKSTLKATTPDKKKDKTKKKEALQVLASVQDLLTAYNGMSDEKSGVARGIEEAKKPKLRVPRIRNEFFEACESNALIKSTYKELGKKIPSLTEIKQNDVFE